MAEMIPACGPVSTNSRGELLLYRLIEEQLGDDFTVVHSLPWLAAAARDLGAKAITGEIDFLIVHAELGVLAIEVKGGVHVARGATFVHVSTGQKTYPVHQVRSNLHGLATWLGADPGLRLRMGYALAFPHSDFKGMARSPSLIDATTAKNTSILLDRESLPRLGARIVEIMQYWKAALKNPSLGHSRKKAILEAVCPAFDGTVIWASRIEWDNRLWLRFTDDQADLTSQIIQGANQIVTGWPGTGKTLVLIEAARKFGAAGKRVLFLTFNALLCGHIERQLSVTKGSKVFTWHSFCRAHSGRSGRNFDSNWLQDGCLDDVRKALEEKRLPEFDVLILDEAQAFKPAWIRWLCSWLGVGQIIVSCDETQVFSFEEGRVRMDELCRIMAIDRPFLLTHAVRSPRAVLERLKAVMKPAFQLTSQRESNGDEIDERLVVSENKSLELVLRELFDSGVKPHEIVVLGKYAWQKTEVGGVQFLTVPKFRGMEAPVIVVIGAEQMSDTELFCAYSRATTLCIAMFDAHKLALDGPDGEFQRILLAKPGYAEAAERARLDAYPGEIVRRSLDVSWFDLKTVSVGWARQWGVLLVEQSGPLSSFWIDYLATHYHWTTCSWNERALNQVRLSLPTQDVVKDGTHGEAHALLSCGACTLFTPHRLDEGYVKVCLRCTGELTTNELPPSSDFLLHLKALDKLVSESSCGPSSAEKRRLLPLSLAAGAALQKALHNNSAVRGVGLLGGRVSYHAAMGFMVSLINLTGAGRKIVVHEFADQLYARYLVPVGLSQHQWRKEMSQATSVLLHGGHLKKLKKGVYALVAGATSDGS